MYLSKNNAIVAGYVLVHLAGILLLYMQAAEVFAICSEIISSSNKTFVQKK